MDGTPCCPIQHSEPPEHPQKFTSHHLILDFFFNILADKITARPNGRREP
jgi:hypothetical protein